MKRLELKELLMLECINSYAVVHKFKACLPNRFYWRICRTINRDFKKGLRLINKETKIELPVIASNTDGKKTVS